MGYNPWGEVRKEDRCPDCEMALWKDGGFDAHVYHHPSVTFNVAKSDLHGFSMNVEGDDKVHAVIPTSFGMISACGRVLCPTYKKIKEED